jgi:OOP family OmpA-OmpF porin
MKNYQKKLAGLLVCGAIMTPTLANAEMMHHKNMTAPVEVRTYKEYEHREPCQQYKKLPTQLSPSYDRCVETVTTAEGLLPVVATYTVYFDFNKSTISPEQEKTIQKLIQDVNTYHPTQITVTGHTDTSGSADYNQALSAKRADTVSKVLSKYNVSSFYLNEAALGEQDLAVPTPDGTKLSSNRRVVIQFRK